MGITGLLPLLKDITCDVHLRYSSGKVAAIDVYCWLHKTVISVSKRQFWDRSNAVPINTSFLHVTKVLDFERKLLFSALLTSDFFFRYIDMCMKDTDLLIENNVQPILVFQKKLEGKANVESSSANLLLLRTTAS